LKWLERWVKPVNISYNDSALWLFWQGHPDTCLPFGFDLACVPGQGKIIEKNAGGKTKNMLKCIIIPH
jgi:hypothetical protein